MESDEPRGGPPLCRCHDDGRNSRDSKRVSATVVALIEWTTRRDYHTYLYRHPGRWQGLASCRTRISDPPGRQVGVTSRPSSGVNQCCRRSIVKQFARNADQRAVRHRDVTRIFQTQSSYALRYRRTHLTCSVVHLFKLQQKNRLTNIILFSETLFKVQIID